jgi:hypothetical protein
MGLSVADIVHIGHRVCTLRLLITEYVFFNSVFVTDKDSPLLPELIAGMRIAPRRRMMIDLMKAGDSSVANHMSLVERGRGMPELCRAYAAFAPDGLDRFELA